MLYIIILAVWIVVSYYFESWWTQYWYALLRKDPHKFSIYREVEKVTVYCTYKLFPVKKATGTILNDHDIVLLMQKDNELVQEDERHENYHIIQRRKYGKIIFWNLLFLNYVLLFFVPHDYKPMELWAEKQEKKL